MNLFFILHVHQSTALIRFLEGQAGSWRVFVGFRQKLIFVFGMFGTGGCIDGGLGVGPAFVTFCEPARVYVCLGQLCLEHGLQIRFMTCFGALMKEERC